MTDVTNTERDRVVLPHTMLPELARIPEEVLSGPELAAEVRICRILQFREERRRPQDQ